MDTARVRALLRAQFPEWVELPLVELPAEGTDHTLYRIGDDLVARMPIRPFAGAPLQKQQAGREAKWVPYLAPHVPLELPTPVALGEPTDDYPWHWSIVTWIQGERTDRENTDMERALDDLATFIRALHVIDTTDAPKANSVNWGRGQSLRPGADRIRDAIDRVSDRYDTAPMRAAWEAAIEADEWDRPGVWFHGDLGFNNLISRDRRLVGVIDSPYGVGDPACDLMPAWTMFKGKERERFFEAVGVDEATKIRSRGWVLGPACFGLTYYANVPSMLKNMLGSIECALAD
jgi:aminoglycoside phosphotransferase (APT) family kinase protein